MSIHCVRTPTEPFLTSSGKFRVHQVCVWQDNFSWLLVCEETGEAAVIDGPEAQPVLDYCELHSFQLTTILNTHTHGDHIGINMELRSLGMLSGIKVVGSSRRAADIPGISNPVDEGDVYSFGAIDCQVWLTEGHIDGHVSFLIDDVLFCGDTLFGGGCGYLFDGPPAKMQRSLERFLTLPDSTRVCCAHEYTQDNLRFAWSVDAGNPHLEARIADTWRARSLGLSTVPSSIGLERMTNPFMRWGAASVRDAAKLFDPDLDVTDPVEVFAATRRLKDSKAYRDLSDMALPLPTQVLPN